MLLCFYFVIASFVDIDIRSRGCNDPGKPHRDCSATFIKVYEKNYAPRGKGHNVVIVDAKTGTIVQEDSFQRGSFQSFRRAIPSILHGRHRREIMSYSEDIYSNAYKLCVGCFG